MTMSLPWYKARTLRMDLTRSLLRIEERVHRQRQAENEMLEQRMYFSIAINVNYLVVINPKIRRWASFFLLLLAALSLGSPRNSCTTSASGT